MKNLFTFEEFLNEGKSNENLNENADYKYLVDLIINAKPKYNVYYNPSQNVVNIGGVGYDKGSLVSQFNGNSGESDKIKFNFYYASKNPTETKKQVEKLSNGKIEVDITSTLVKYILK